MKEIKELKLDVWFDRSENKDNSFFWTGVAGTFNDKANGNAHCVEHLTNRQMKPSFPLN